MSGQPSPGTRWGGFLIEQELGGGGWGRVFRAVDPTDHRVVAIKVLDPSSSPTARERFVRDNEVASRLGHPRIVPIERVGDVDGTPFVVMAFVEGGDLSGELRQGPLTLPRVEVVVTQLGAALDRAHRAGLVHGGLGPEDVLVRPNGDVLLTGFGTPTDRHRPHRCSPEQLRGMPAVPSSDIYALGCLLFECLTGRVPFPAATAEDAVRQHLEAPRPTVTSLRPDLPADLDGIVAATMALDPGGRPPDGHAVGEALRSVTVRPSVSEPGPADDTAVLPAAAPAHGGRRPVLDGAAFGVYDDDDGDSRAPAVIGGLFTVAILLVAVLVWRAVNTDAELELPASAPVPSTTTVATAGPTVEELELLVPSAVEGCAPAEEQPVGDPPSVVVQCRADGVPESTTFVLYSSVGDRDDAFDALAAGVLGVGEPDGEDCALGRSTQHDYIGVQQVGRLACRRAEDRVDLLWTTDIAPLLVSSGGDGSFADHYAWWASIVDRTDAAFPLDVERDLLDQIPSAQRDDCDRDLALLVGAGGDTAVTCAPEDGAAASVSWVRFAATDAMDGWFDRRRDDRPDDAPAEPEQTCTPDAGAARYDLDGSTGRILCFVSPDRTGVVVWTRDDVPIGSVATAARPGGPGLADLLRWFEAGGHRP